MLLDERDFMKQNHTKIKEKYVDVLLRDNLGADPVECVKIHPNRMDHQHVGSFTKRRRSRNRHPHCDNKLLLDQTYYVYSFDVSRYSNSTEQAPLIIFVAVHDFPGLLGPRGRTRTLCIFIGDRRACLRGLTQITVTLK